MRHAQFAFVSTLLLALLCALLAGCTSEPATPPVTDPGALTLTPAGGSYALNNSATTLTAPAGAVGGNVTLVVREVAPAVAASHGTAFGRAVVYAFGPTTITLEADATLELAFNPTYVPEGLPAANVRVCALEDGAWAPLEGSSANLTTGRVTVPVRRLGTFCVMLYLDTGEPTAPAYIPDASLLAALRTILAKPSGSITVGELAALTGRLDLSNNDIADLRGLEHCTAISDLVLWHNRVVDLTPIARLTNLTRLSAGKNAIASVRPLQGLGHLRELLLVYNQVTDITPLTALPLERMSLSANPVADFSPLAEIPTLTTFYMAHSELTTIPFAPYIASVRELWLEDNALTDLTPLASLPALDAVYLYHNQIASLQPLVDNPALAAGDTVEVYTNALDLTAGSAASTQVAALQARGVTVVTTAPTAARMPESP